MTIPVRTGGSRLLEVRPREPWHGGARKVDDHLPVGYEELPDTVVLQLREPIETFNVRVQETTDMEYSAYEVFSEILIYLSDYHHALSGLEELLLAMERTYPGKDGEIIGKASREMGIKIFEQITHYRLYAADHRLHYAADERDWIDRHTVVLRKQAAVYSHQVLSYWTQQQQHRTF